MVIDQQGYDELIMYLTEHLSLFEKTGEVTSGAPTVMALIEDDIAEQIINFCMQHSQLSVDDRSAIIREVDGIVYDLQEVLSGVLNKPVTNEQHAFIDEFAGLVKNLFDAAVSES